MVLIVLLIITILCLSLNRLVAYLRFRKLLNQFDGKDDGHPFFGDAIDFTAESDKNFNLLRDYSRRFPNSYRIWSVLGVGVVCINTPEHAELLLSSPKHIKKSALYNFVKSWLKTGLLTSDGTKWFNRRKLLTPAFHFNILQKLIIPFAEHNRLLVKKLKEECHKDKTNIVPIISHTALNLICATTMEVNLDPNDTEQTEYRKAIHEFNPILQTKISTPWYYIEFLYKYIYRFTSLHRREQKILNVLHGFTKKIIKTKEKLFSKENIDNNSYSRKRSAMLELLLTAKENGEINDEGIQEEVDTLTFEGHDTVSMALSFVLLVLANEPEAQQKIADEMETLFEGTDRDATIQDLKNMHYLEMCLKECLRLFPSVSFVSRFVEEEIKLDDKLTIPAECIVHVHIYDIHRNKKHFPDPDKFIPERFSKENSLKRHPFAFIPFSAGPRNCIGQKYAMLELKSIVSCIIRNFKLLPVDKISDIVLSTEIVLRPKDAINVKFIPRYN